MRLGRQERERGHTNLEKSIMGMSDHRVGGGGVKTKLNEKDKSGKTVTIANTANVNNGKKLMQDIGGNTFISAAAHTAMRRATDIGGNSSNHGSSHNLHGRVKEGTSVLIDALKTLGSWHRPKDSSDEEGSRGQDGDRRERGDGSKDEDNDDHENEDEKKDKDKHHTIRRPTSAGRRKFDRVRNKLAGASLHGFSFASGSKDDSTLVDSRPDVSGLTAESRNDAYFQEIMRGD